MYESKDSVFDPPLPPPPPVTIGIPATGMASLQVSSQADGRWSTGLCDCCDDVSNCCITCFCPCITFGQIAEIVDQGSTSCLASGALYTLLMIATGCQCIFSCLYRSKLRKQYSLPESPCCDCLVNCCCEQCALCQEYRELQRRGFNMDIGYQANMANQGHGHAVLPPNVQAGMAR
ncbi:hypothetical protein J5N97_009604 [Dioscorea zingiberensis]|uniref:Uncharacterized protein n=1 Tax=Dioscorea zingiberensis TaxID=325984 RepID=A0A9D5HLT7_9LILI|nr:hypothetical protein J5N97_009604 [Dioscorea zingiberensis]